MKPGRSVGGPVFRLSAAAGGVAAAAALAAILLLSLLPALFGKAPAITVSPVDQALCILDPDGSAGIIAAGDSRALYHVIPSVIQGETGRKCINLGQWLHLGGDPTTLVNSLRRHPGALATHPIVILSVTVDGLNDFGFKGLPKVAIFNWSPWDHFRVLLERQKAYPEFLVTSLLPDAMRLAKNRMTGNQFRCGEGIYRPPRLLLDQGFEPYEGRKKSGFWHMPEIEADYRLEGGQRKNLAAALDWLTASPAGRVILLSAPIDTAWLLASNGPTPLLMEARLSELLQKEAERNPKVAVLDFYRHPLAELADSLFYDQTHLNHRGAEIFSRHLGRLLAGTGPGKGP